MGKHKNRQRDPQKEKEPVFKSDVFKKYAAPICINYLYYEQLQRDFFMSEKDKPHERK